MYNCLFELIICIKKKINKNSTVFAMNSSSLKFLQRKLGTKLVKTERGAEAIKHSSKVVEYGNPGIESRKQTQDAKLTLNWKSLKSNWPKSFKRRAKKRGRERTSERRAWFSATGYAEMNFVGPPTSAMGLTTLHLHSAER